MTLPQKVEIVRRWVTTVIVILVIPIVKLFVDNQRMSLKEEFNGIYVTQRDDAERWSEHKSTEAMQREMLLEKITESNAKVDAVKATLDACVLNLNTMQTESRMRGGK